MLQHGLGNDVLISGMGTSFKKTLLRVFGCEGQRGKGIHDQVDPKHLNGFENFGLEDCCTYQCADNCNYVDCKLELDEFSDGVVDVTTPKHCLDYRVEVVVDENDCSCLASHLCS